MKRVLAILITVTAVLLYVAPALAQQPRISPESIEFDVPIDNSTEVEFTVYDFTGDIEISLYDMGLIEVIPAKVNVAASAVGTPIKLRFYGAPS